MTDTAEPIDPADLDAFSEGALPTMRAVEWSGIPRSELFDLMKAGVVRWYLDGKSRRLSRKDLQAELARRFAAHKRAPKVSRTLKPKRRIGR